MRDQGIGERADLLIQAVSPDGNATECQPVVVIEVKCDANLKDEDIPEQLVRKYLDGKSRNCGIYLVGWFGLGKKLSLKNCRERATQIASENSLNGIRVSARVIDLTHRLHSSP